jgi:1,4-dihydroxy-2-naphthoate octaprenyltransferase
MSLNSNAIAGWKVWVHAARPRTLWAAVTPVIVGASLAFRDGVFHGGAAMAALLGSVAIQIGTNFANDYYDWKRGADTHERLGPLRVTQAGLVTPAQMRLAMWIVFGFAVLDGAFLVWRAGWPILAAGLLSVGAGILYTGGPFPFGYHGLGDVFVFIFFGVIAVSGTYYAQALKLNSTVLLLSIPIGLLATAILVVNNLRDIDTDREAGKMTLAVRLGRRGTRWEFAILLLAIALVPPVLVLMHACRPGVLLASVAMLLSIPLLRTVFRHTDGPTLNRALADTARLQLVYGCLLAIGLQL